MDTSRFKQAFVWIFYCTVVLSCCVWADTWYVDPVNGSDTYDGTSPFHVPNTSTGPKETIEDAVYMTGQYDIIILADGVYSEQYNTSSNVFDLIDMHHLYVTSANGPDNCILELYETIYFQEPQYSADEKTTCLSDLTFTAVDPYLSPGPLWIMNNSRVCFKNCVYSGFQTTLPIIRIEYSYPTFDGCRFENNQIQDIIRCFDNASPEFKNCSFTNNTNSPDRELTLVKAMEGSGLTAEGCTFADNIASGSLYGVHTSGFITVENCVFENNISGEYCVGINCEYNTGGFISGTRFESLRINGNSGQIPGSGIAAGMSENLIIYDCQFYNNDLGIYLNMMEGQNDITIDNCEFVGNAYDADPYTYEKIGGIFLVNLNQETDLEIRECVFQKNYAGIQLWYGANSNSFIVENCLATDNTYCGITVNNNDPGDTEIGLLTVNNCTFANNGEFALASNFAIVENSILRQEQADPIPVGGIGPFPNITCNYCNIQGGWTGPGTDNIDVDPLFADPGIWNPNPELRIPGTDYHLKSTAGRWDLEQDTLVFDDEDSPCIDTGNPAVVSYFEPTGSGGRINMGAYGNTWQASRTNWCTGGYRNSGMMFGDINNDCIVNLADFVVIAAQWLESTIDETPLLY